MESMVQKAEREFVGLLDLYKELLDVSNQIDKCLKQRDWQALEDNICSQAAIQKNIDERRIDIDQLQASFCSELGMKNFDLAALERRFPDTKLGNILTQLMDVMAKLESKAASNEKRLRLMISEVQLERGDLQKGQKAAKAYQPKPSSWQDGRFVDEKK